MKKPLIFIVQNIVPHYRIEFFNILCDSYDVVLIHSGSSSNSRKVRFSEFIIPSYKVGPLILQVGLFKLINKLKPAAIIASADIRNIISIVAMYFYDTRLKWIWWGLDIGASNLATLIKLRVCKRNNPVVFYNETIMNNFISLGLSREKLFFANNTFHVQESASLANELPKDIFLNVGTLDARKENDILIKAFNHIVNKFNKDLYLVLVGNGAEKQKLVELIGELNLQERVLLVGHIDDPLSLQNYYKRAIASVSFGQAGLAVLQSMAFGVPFVTKNSAISGGEKYNIIHEYNGFFCSDSLDSLINTLELLVQNPELSKKIGQNAFDYYCEKASVDIMVRGFTSALNFVVKA